MTRPLPAVAYNGLKTAWKLLVDDLGGVEATAAVTRVSSKGRISEYGALHTDRFPAIDVVLDAEHVAGEPRVTAALARALGYALTPVEPRGAGDLSVLLAELGRDVASLFADAATALRHTDLTDEERMRLARDLDEVSCAAAEARARLLPPPTSQGADPCRSIPRR